MASGVAGMTAAGGCDAGVPGQFEDPNGGLSQNLMSRLAPLRRQWDLAVLANLAAGTERPGDLIEAMNAQASDSPRVGWKSSTTHRGGWNEAATSPDRRCRACRARPVTGGAPPGHRLTSAASLLDTWYDDHEPDTGTPWRAIPRAPDAEPGRQHQGRAPLPAAPA
jgi:hypothetical protein